MPAASGMTVRAKDTSLGIVTERKGWPPKWRAVRDRTERTTCARRPGPRDQPALPLRPIQKPTLSPIAPPARAAGSKSWEAAALLHSEGRRERKDGSGGHEQPRDERGLQEGRHKREPGTLEGHLDKKIRDRRQA